MMSSEDSDVRARFQREIRVVGRLNHPSIVAATDAGEIDRTQFLDFGLAQLSVWDEASVDLTTVGQLMGTLDYMAPEQAELSGGVDYRADLYGMGATLFRLLCGRPPLAAAPNQSPLEKLRMLANHQPPKLDTLCPEAPAELVALVGSMLARSAQDRPASAAHVAEQLAAFTESANLVSLLKRAQEKEALSPEPIASERNRRGERRSTGGLTPPRSPEAANIDGGRRKRRWLVTAAILPLLLIAGIFVKLETEKGQLVIESDVANVKVQIIHDGKPVSGLSINQGATATRLRADKYEIIIDGPSDGLTIDNNQFTLQSGTTVIARIRLSPTLEPAPAPTAIAGIPNEAPALQTTEPLYDGKTLSQWLEMLSRERSPAGLKSAFDACKALVSPDTSDLITQTILRVVPTLDGEFHLNDQPPDTLLDQAAFEVLVKANPDADFYTLWVEQFEKGDEKWRMWLWKNIAYGGGQIGPFVTWAENRLLKIPDDGQSAGDNLKAADFLQSSASLPMASGHPDLLSLARKLDGVGEIQPQLNSLLKTTQDTLELIHGMHQKRVDEKK